MIRILATAALFCANALPSVAQKPPLLPEKDVAALSNELSGEIAKRNLEGITRLHRQRGSQGFHSAAEIIVERARAYGLTDAQVLQFPADGKIYYGAQRSRPPWDADFAELWELVNNQPAVKISSYEAEPVTLAEDSESADVSAYLVDVSEGTKESDYTGKDVKGQIVLAAAQPDAVQDLAIGKFGAAGIVSYAQNQKTAWYGEDENLIRWGHLETFSPNKTFAFMVSLKTAREYRARLAASQKIQLHAVVKAGQHPGFTEVVTATIPGSDPNLKNEEIAFSCHLDHQRPGANDNASGCVTILEVARTLQRLIDQKQIARPSRTLRFVWPPEIEGTLALLNAKPEFAQRIKAVIHMDMVGGNQNTKSVFHVTRGPRSLPSFVHDVAWAFGNFVNDQSYNFAAGLPAQYPLIAPEGGKEPLLALDAPYTMGSDHEVYQDSSFAIPAIYLNDWPDRYIHTNFDSASNIDPTKLKRAAFIGAASGYYLAIMNAKNLPKLEKQIHHGADLWRDAMFPRENSLTPDEIECMRAFEDQFQWGLQGRLARFLNTKPEGEKETSADRSTCASDRYNSGDASLRFVRKQEPRGPVAVFGSNYFADRAKANGVAMPKIFDYEGQWGGGEEYAFETLNFVDGVLNAQQIRNRVSAEYGPIPLELVVEYLKDLEKIGLLERQK
jgi:aminopeptidase YwaD